MEFSLYLPHTFLSICTRAHLSLYSLYSWKYINIYRNRKSLGNLAHICNLKYSNWWLSIYTILRLLHKYIYYIMHKLTKRIYNTRRFIYLCVCVEHRFYGESPARRYNLAQNVLELEIYWSLKYACKIIQPWRSSLLLYLLKRASSLYTV